VTTASARMAARFQLRARDVDLWVASLDEETARIQELAETLSDDERARASRFAFGDDRRHFTIARGLLRAILSKYTGVASGELEFTYGPSGKPALTGSPETASVRFSLSHSAELAVYALTRDREIGVDVERLRPIRDSEQIAARFFCEQEQAALRALPTSVREEAFFDCWTRKEAYLKAVGDGLRMLDRVRVSLDPSEPARLLAIDGDAGALSRWSLHALRPAPGYTGALVVESYGRRLECRRWAVPSDLG
jgi:4'-phosphopantetheinyl transferase